jgi:hypothetical protein
MLGNRGQFGFIMVALVFIFAAFLFYQALTNRTFSSFEQTLLILFAVVMIGGGVVAVAKS